jgi:phosphatidylglycerol:prolipoprotein diacylglycerol transferase
VPVWRNPLFTLAKIRRRKVVLPILPFADLILSVFPVAWIFGRSGCSVVHDHPGIRVPVAGPLTVGYPTESQLAGLRDAGKITFFSDGPIHRFDLGMLELMFTIVIAAAFALTWRRKLTVGSYVAAVSLAYAPVRMLMDFLRIREGESADPRYAMLTPAQWSCIALFLLGVAMIVQVRRIRASGTDPLDMLRLPPDDVDAPEPGVVETP